jgi:L-cysteine S-thiosulfotransferase
MKARARGFLAALIVAATAGVAVAQMPLNERRTGYDLLGPTTKAMQDDDTANPGMLWVLDGETLWARQTGTSGKACAGCHGDAAESMKGVAARYPAFDAHSGRPIDLEQRINQCRVDSQGAPALARESRELNALTVFVARQSRGLPIEDILAKDGRLKPFLEAGRALFEKRQGQLNLSCAQCHEELWDKHLAGNTISQAHPTGYPQYRLEWQTMGSLQRRLRNCLIGLRAETYPYGAPEYVDLALYLMWRARGLPLEAPAVRP